MTKSKATEQCSNIKYALVALPRQLLLANNNNRYASMPV